MNCHDKSDPPHPPGSPGGQHGGSLPGLLVVQPCLAGGGNPGACKLPLSVSPLSCCSVQHFTVYKAPFAQPPSHDTRQGL